MYLATGLVHCSGGQTQSHLPHPLLDDVEHHLHMEVDRQQHWWENCRRNSQLCFRGFNSAPRQEEGNYLLQHIDYGEHVS